MDSSTSEEESDASFDEYSDEEIDWNLIPNYSTTGSPEDNLSFLEDSKPAAKKSSSFEDSLIDVEEMDDVSFLDDSKPAAKKPSSFKKSIINVEAMDESIINEHREMLLFASTCIGEDNSVLFKDKFKLCKFRGKRAHSSEIYEILDNAILKYGFNSNLIIKYTSTGLRHTQITGYVHRRKKNYIFHMIIDRYLGSKCCWCGDEASMNMALEFDHCNEKNKVKELADLGFTLYEFCFEVMKCRRLCKDCHYMRTAGQRKGKHEAFKKLPMEEKHKQRLEYIQNNIGVSGFQLEGNVLTNHWLSIGHQSRERLTIKHMKTDDRWLLISNKYSEKETEVRVRTYSTYEGKKFSNKELEME
jgi:hypothetical protein